MNVEDLINLSQGNMSLEEYSLKFTLLSKYATSLVANTRYEMSRFVIGVFSLVKEECCKDMLHNDMNLSTLIVYEKSIEESNLSRISINLKKGRSNDQNQPSSKKRAPNQGGSSAPKVMYERGVGSQGVKPSCSTYVRKHFGIFQP